MKSLDSIFLKYLHTRLHIQNKNYMAFFTGETGSGKSEASIYTAWKIDPDLDINHVVFSGEELLSLLNTPGELKKGDPVVGEETGVGIAGSREWMTRENRAMGKIAQTFRHRNLAVLWTVPAMSFVDKQLRILGHSLFITKYINYRRETCKLKHYKLQHDPRSGETYKKRAKFRLGNSVVLMPFITTRRPPKKLLKDYLKKKEEFTSALNLESENTLRNDGKSVSEIKIDSRKQENKDIADEILKKHKNIIKLWRGKKTPETSGIRNLYDVSFHRAADIKALVEADLNG